MVITISALVYYGLTVESCKPESISATILTKAADPFGRLISYILVGEEIDRFENDQEAYVDLKSLDATVNIQMLNE